MVIKPMMVPARIFFILAISRYLHKDDYGLSQNDRGRFTDYRNFLFVVAVIQKSTLRKCAEQQSASCEFLSQIGQAKDARDYVRITSS